MTLSPNYSTAESGSKLTINRLTCRFNLPYGANSVNFTRDQLTRIAEREVARVCSETFNVLPGDDEAVYRMRSLRLDLWIDLPGMSESQIAQRWGTQLSNVIIRAMRSGPSQQVMRFDSPQHFISAFLRDLLDGRAWNLWYYDEFRVLQRLSVGAIALFLLGQRPGWLLPVLTALSATGHAERLIEQWDHHDLTQLWQALELPLTPVFTNDLTIFKELAERWNKGSFSKAIDANSRARDRIRLWLEFVRAHPDKAQDENLGCLIHLLVDLAALMKTESESASLLSMESGLYPALQRRIITGPLADILEWIEPLCRTATGPGQLARLVNVIKPSHRVATSHDVTISPVGNVFLLAPALAELDLWQLWLNELGEEMARCYIFILALKALGKERAPLYIGDKALTQFAGLKEPPLADARLPLPPDNPKSSLKSNATLKWIAMLPAICVQWYPMHERRLVFTKTRNLFVLRDFSANHWLAAWPKYTPNIEIDAVWSMLKTDLNQVQHEISDQEQALMDAETDHLQLGQMLGYPWLTPSIDAALSVVTSLLLRRTAARLPGFPNASPAYLARQFLALPATVELRSDELTVKLSGGPLAIVLNMASIPEQLNAPWLARSLSLKISA